MNANKEVCFRLFLRNCTNSQLQAVYDRERHAGRNDFAELALMEAELRGADIYRY